MTINLKVEERDGLYRIVDADTGAIAINTRTKKPMDARSDGSAGHTNNQKAERQLGYIVAGMNKKK